jgi:soluble lytic murein transglycosylase-like protein
MLAKSMSEDSSVVVISMLGRAVLTVTLVAATLFVLLAPRSIGHSAMRVDWLVGAYSALTTAALEAPGAADVVVKPSAEETRYAVLAQSLAKRFNLVVSDTLDVVRIAHVQARQFGLDPLLVVAMIAVESRFNPLAESPMGAKGLMQIIPQFHLAKFSKFGGEQAIYDPEPNIHVGIRILKSYLLRTGDMTSALQSYAGAVADQSDAYTQKVMSEKQRLESALHQAQPQLRATTAHQSTVLAQDGQAL